MIIRRKDGSVFGAIVQDRFYNFIREKSIPTGYGTLETIWIMKPLDGSSKRVTWFIERMGMQKIESI
jgi:hypothetical protein